MNSGPLPSTGDPLADEWVHRVYALLRENNGTVQACLDAPEEDFTALPAAAQQHLRDLTEEMLGDLMPRQVAA